MAAIPLAECWSVDMYRFVRAILGWEVYKKFILETLHPKAGLVQQMRALEQKRHSVVLRFEKEISLIY